MTGPYPIWKLFRHAQNACEKMLSGLRGGILYCRLPRTFHGSALRVNCKNVQEQVRTMLDSEAINTM